MLKNHTSSKRLPTTSTSSQSDVKHTKSSMEFMNTECSVVYSPNEVDELEEDETAEFTMTFQCAPEEFEVSGSLSHITSKGKGGGKLSSQSICNLSIKWIRSVCTVSGGSRISQVGAGRQAPGWGRQTIIWLILSQKLHEIKRNLTRGGRSWCPPYILQ